MEAKDMAGFICPRPRPCHPGGMAAAAGGRSPFELRLVFARDAPVDRTGRDQIYCYALAASAFDLVHAQPRPLETRGELRSP